MESGIIDNDKTPKIRPKKIKSKPSKLASRLHEIERRGSGGGGQRTFSQTNKQKLS